MRPRPQLLHFVQPVQCLQTISRCLFSKTGTWEPKFDSREIESHWKPQVKEHDKRQADEVTAPGNEEVEKFYALSMFPYPSGNLHLGHVRVYTISDVMARYQKAKGKLVIHPMGWDAFGLPAENAAIERNINPKDWTYNNIDKMRDQLQNMGFSFDWSREVMTCDPEYYRWTQYIFLKMHENGLAYQKKGLVNWDPVDMTVLADTQIDEEGKSWRSGAKAEKKYLTQWFLRDTTFSQSLLDGLDEVDPTLWRDIISVQRHWISECTGRRVQFEIEWANGKKDFPESVYSENLDLLYGVSHLCVTPEHCLAIESGITEEGAILPVFAVHPLTNRRLNLVVTHPDDMTYKRDIVLGIPSISKKDADLATKLNFQITQVLDDNECLINSENLTGFSRSEATDMMCQKAKELGFGGEKIGSKLTDWLISRQRYWGTPIPIIHCPKCKTVPVPYEDLPVTLPDTKKLVSKGGKSPLEEDSDWLNVPCPKCGTPSKRETDTMDTFVDSTWYFLRYLDPNNKSQPFNPDIANKYMPVNLYVGGKEHALLHLYYARFVCHFLHSLGLLKTREPFINLLPQGVVKAESFKVKNTGRYIAPDMADRSGKVVVDRETGEEVVVEWEKMSKSKHNGVNPEDVLEEFGIDTTRLCILSNVSPMTERNWDRSVFAGVLNWQRRTWNLVSVLHEKQHCEVKKENLSKVKEWEEKIDVMRNMTISSVTQELDRTFNVNAAISRLHKYVTQLRKVPDDIKVSSKAYERAVGDLVVIVAVMAPHFASELWAGLAHVAKDESHHWDKNVLDQDWPKVDENIQVPLEYQVNGISIADIGVPSNELDKLDESKAFFLVCQDEIFKQRFSGLKISHKSYQSNGRSKATFKLTIPEFDFKITGTQAQREKKIRKLNRQKRRLHNL